MAKQQASAGENASSSSEGGKKKGLSRGAKWGIGCGGLLIVLIIIGVLASSGGDNNGSSSSGDSSSSSNTASAPSTPTAKVGEEIKVGDIRWKVLGVKDFGSTLRGSDSQYPTITDNKTSQDGKFVQVEVYLKNEGKDLRSASDLTILDKDSREFSSCSDCSEWVPNEKSLYILSNVNPGTSYTFQAIYEVAKDATGLKLKVGDLKFLGAQQGFVDLGI